MTALAESFPSTSIHNIFSWPISTFLHFSRVRKPVLDNGLLHHLRRIYVLNSGNLQLHVLQYLHDHPLTGHFGQTKTLHQVHMQYYWSRLPVYVKDYCKLCTTCSHAKPV